MATFRDGLLRLGTPPYRKTWRIAFYGSIAGIIALPLFVAPGLLTFPIVSLTGTARERIFAGFSVYAVLWIFLGCLWFAQIGIVASYAWIRSAAKRAGVWDAA